MAYTIITGTGVAAAWSIALLFLKCKRSVIWFHALIAGGISAAAQYVLYFTDMSHLSESVSMAVFLLITLALGLELPGFYGNAVLALLMARSAFCIFRFAADFEKIGIVMSLLLSLIFVAAAWRLRSIFPADDWREYFSGAAPGDKKLNVRIWQIYLALGLQCVLCSGCAAALTDLFALERLLLLLVLCVVFWGFLLGVSLMIEYRRETMAALINQQYRDEMQSFMNVIRSQRHDYNFHVQTLARMLKTGDMTACEKYVDELVQDSIAMNTLLPVRDPAISAMINNFRTLAAREGIELHIDIQNDLSHVVTNVYETNKIISNLLQNAIDETKTHSDKSYGIHLMILKRGEYCVIHVTNAFYTELSAGQYVRNIYSHGYTTKPGHDGVGLSSVKSLLERYRGVIYTQVEQETIRFTAKIPLRYEANTEDRMIKEEMYEFR